MYINFSYLICKIWALIMVFNFKEWNFQLVYTTCFMLKLFNLTRFYDNICLHLYDRFVCLHKCFVYMTNISIIMFKYYTQNVLQGTVGNKYKCNQLKSYQQCSNLYQRCTWFCFAKHQEFANKKELCETDLFFQYTKILFIYVYLLAYIFKITYMKFQDFFLHTIAYLPLSTVIVDFKYNVPNYFILQFVYWHI